MSTAKRMMCPFVETKPHYTSYPKRRPGGLRHWVYTGGKSEGESEMHRRYFLMGSLAAGAVVRSRAVASPNETVRIACVGVHAQGREHIKRYSAMQNVEIAAICDVDE